MIKEEQKKATEVIENFIQNPPKLPPMFASFQPKMDETINPIVEAGKVLLEELRQLRQLVQVQQEESSILAQLEKEQNQTL